MSLKERINEDMKSALRAKETQRLSAIRLLLAAVKQREVDERKDLSDPDVVVVIDKMIKQRRESISQYERANRQASRSTHSPIGRINPLSSASGMKCAGFTIPSSG